MCYAKLIPDLADTLITLLKRCAYWGALTHPIMERANGYLAHVCGDQSASSYHLNRSILEARRWKLEMEESRTQELMQQLGVPILGMDQKCKEKENKEEEKVGSAAV